jgi:hypothetical protein
METLPILGACYLISSTQTYYILFISRITFVAEGSFLACVCQILINDDK